MDLSKLSANQKLGAYGALAALVGGLAAVFSYTAYSGSWIGVLAALGMLAVLFLPQLSPGTKLPGSVGSLMLITGAVAGLVLALLFLVNIGFVFTRFGIPDLFFLVAVVGGLVMAWAGWQEFQAEGGTLHLGSSAPAAHESTVAGGAAADRTDAVVATDAPAPAEPATERTEAAPASAAFDDRPVDAPAYTDADDRVADGRADQRPDEERPAT